MLNTLLSIPRVFIGFWCSAKIGKVESLNPRLLGTHHEAELRDFPLELKHFSIVDLLALSVAICFCCLMIFLLPIGLGYG